ncbi:hypothetical protein [Acinetobacter soli]|uniref:hypothetical protein n=1 Tax=Acinetobacter soli TaxID=487316 RepID=UPI000E5A5EEB|nr:hypothetical protein [Acinetobacter soli]
MKTTITKIALAAAFLSTAAMANATGPMQISINTGATSIIDALARYADKTTSTAFNLAVNTGNVDASVNTFGAFNSLKNVGSTIAVETSALGAANTGDIYLEQGSLNASSSGAVAGSMAAASAASGTSGWGWHSNSSYYGSAFNSAYGANFDNSLDETLSNYSAANIAYNSGSIDASVNTVGLVNRINGISTSAVGAVNTGGISVVVK